MYLIGLEDQKSARTLLKFGILELQNYGILDLNKSQTSGAQPNSTVQFKNSLEVGRFQFIIKENSNCSAIIISCSYFYIIMEC